SGEEPQRQLVGVLVYVNPHRAYWSHEFSGVGTPPDCVSADTITGVGDPGGTCLLCPHSRYQNGEAPACRLTADCVFFQPGELLPTVLTASPTSVPIVEKYVLALIKRGLRYSDTVTTFGLERVTGRGGTCSRRLTATRSAVLEPPQRQRMREIVMALGLTPAASAPAGQTPVPTGEREPGCDDGEIPEHATLDLTT